MLNIYQTLLRVITQAYAGVKLLKYRSEVVERIFKIFPVSFEQSFQYFIIINI